MSQQTHKQGFRGPSPEQEKILWDTITLLCIVVLTCFGVLVFYGIIRLALLLQEVLIPLAIGAVLACILHPVVIWLEGRGMRRDVAVIGIFAFCLIALVSLGLVLVPSVLDQIDQLKKSVPDNLAKLQGMHQSYLLKYPWITDVLDQSKEWVSKQWPAYSGQLSFYALDIIKKIFGGIGIFFGLLCVPVYVYYFLLETAGIEKSWKEFIPLRRSWIRDEAIVIIGEIQKYMITFFRGQVLIGIILGTLTGIGLAIAGLNYALLIGLLVAILSLIPFLGVLLTLLPSLAIAYTQSDGNWIYVGVIAGVFAIVQTIEGLWITPKIMGDRTGLHPVTIIISIMIWTIIFGGLLGAILAVPLTATLKVLMFRYVWIKDEPQGGNVNAST